MRVGRKRPTAPPVKAAPWRGECAAVEEGPSAVCCQGLIRIPNTTTADCPGPSDAMVAVTVPAAPLAGVAMTPTVVEAGMAFEYVVFAGVASLTTTLVTVAVPTLVTVIWYRRHAPGTAPVVMLSVL